MRIIAGILFAVAAAGQAGEDIVLADFEGETYGDWKAEGEAFGKGPARGTLEKQQEVSGYLGKGFVNSYLRGDATQGTLSSPEFKVSRKHLNFLIGGGKHPGETGINLLVEGKAVRSATGPDSEFLRWHSWDVSEFAGKAARIEIVDRHAGGWGHINIDQIVLSDARPKMEDDRAGALARAAASVEEATKKAAGDPLRPVYHFLPPGNWMNDPNGPIFHNGVYHMFYQQNPYGDKWNHMHWGHARSKDLVHWEHLPIALWPSKIKGEDHCFSGCAAVDAQGRLLLLYTSIGGRAPEQWAALSEDDEGRAWKKHVGNPILTLADHGDVKINEWRDPFVFKEAGRWYMVVGGHRAGGKGCIMLYSSEDLLKWKFLGIPFEGKEQNWECPNLFRIGEKWVLIYSPHGLVRYYTGRLDLAGVKFTPEHHGTVDFSGNYYAPNGLEDAGPRRILWGWVKDFPEGKGWNGCLTVPRVLSLDAEGRLLQAPAPELQALRGESRKAAPVELVDSWRLLPDVKGDTLELIVEFEPGDAKEFGVRLRRSEDRARSVTIQCGGGRIDLAGAKAPLEAKGVVQLRVLLDRSVVEVFADGGRTCMTRVVKTQAEDLGVEVFASGGKARLKSLEAWSLKPIR